MRAAAIVTAVLGLGTALVFALALVAFELFPDGGSFVGSIGGAIGGFGGPVVGIAQPAPGVVVMPAQPMQSGPDQPFAVPPTIAPTSDPASPAPTD
jgi:hypothetical protein